MSGPRRGTGTSSEGRRRGEGRRKGSCWSAHRIGVHEQPPGFDCAARPECAPPSQQMPTANAEGHWSARAVGEGRRRGPSARAVGEGRRHGPSAWAVGMGRRRGVGAFRETGGGRSLPERLTRLFFFSKGRARRAAGAAAVLQGQGCAQGAHRRVQPRAEPDPFFFAPVLFFPCLMTSRSVPTVSAQQAGVDVQAPR